MEQETRREADGLLPKQAQRLQRGLSFMHGDRAKREARNSRMLQHGWWTCSARLRGSLQFEGCRLWLWNRRQEAQQDTLNELLLEWQGRPLGAWHQLFRRVLFCAPTD